MIKFQQELPQLQVEFSQLIDRWNGLTHIAQAKAWATYTESLDEGTSGYHPFGRLLINAWCGGWSAIGGVSFDHERGLGPRMQIAA